ncbi:MAG: MATE family efflux transporter [Thermoprotei archaeon]|nr:MAG: MATE family efflux transporter [Thermoprotei archaeon]
MESVERYRERIVSGSIVRTLLWLGFPLMIVQLVQISYNIADAFWLSRYSDIAMAIPRQAWPPIMFFSAISMALSTANLALISQYVGAKEFKAASKVASKYFTASIILGSILGATYIALRPVIFIYVMRVPSEIYDDVIAYAGVIAIDVTLSYIVLAYSTILQGVGDTRRPALVNVLSALMNIVLDPLLILGIEPFPRLGAIGAAVATVLSRVFSVVALFLIIERFYPELKVKLTRDIGIDWVLTNLKIGTPILILIFSNSIAKMVQLRLVNIFGVAVATAYSIGFVVMDLADATLRGLSRASAIMVGQNIGAGLKGRARKIALKTSAVIFMSTAAGALVVYLLRDYLIWVFTQDPTIYAEAKRFLEVFIWTLPFFGMMINAMFIGRGSGHTLPPSLIGIVRLWGFWVATGYFLALYMGYGPLGIWVGMAVSNIFAGTAALLWLKYGKWTIPVIRRGMAVKGRMDRGFMKPQPMS